MARPQRLQTRRRPQPVRHPPWPHHLHPANGLLHHLLQRSHPHLQRYADVRVRHVVYIVAGVRLDAGSRYLQIKDLAVSQLVFNAEEVQGLKYEDVFCMGLGEYLSGGGHYGHESQVV